MSKKENKYKDNCFKRTTQSYIRWSYYTRKTPMDIIMFNVLSHNVLKPITKGAFIRYIKSAFANGHNHNEFMIMSMRVNEGFNKAVRNGVIIHTEKLPLQIKIATNAVKTAGECLNEVS